MINGGCPKYKNVYKTIETHNCSKNIKNDENAFVILSEIINMFLWSPNLISNAQNIKNKEKTINFPPKSNIHIFQKLDTQETAFYIQFYNTIHICEGRPA